MKATTAAEVMTRGVLTVDADWSVSELATYLEDHAISGAPVIDAEGSLLGVVSVTDIARRGPIDSSAAAAHALYHHGMERVVAREEAARFRVIDDTSKVREIMTPMIFSVEAAAPIEEVADAMIRGRIHRLFVMEDKRLVGVISSLDLLSLIRGS